MKIRYSNPEPELHYHRKPISIYYSNNIDPIFVNLYANGMQSGDSIYKDLCVSVNLMRVGML